MTKLDTLQPSFASSLLTTCLVGLGTGLFVYWLRLKIKYKYPPGPWCPPLVGHLLQIDMHNLLYEVAKWSEKYGPVVTVRLGPSPLVVINKIDEALEVLVKKSTDFADRPHSPSTDLFSQGKRDIAFADYGATWKLHRSIASKALRQYMLGPALENRLRDALESAFEELDKKLNTEPFNPTEYINFIVGNILSGLCFGGKYKFSDKDVHYILEKEDALLHLLDDLIEDIVPFILYFYKSKSFKTLEKASNEIMDDFIGKRYSDVVDTFDKDNIRHITDNFILARLEAEEEGGSGMLESLTDTHIIQIVGDIFFAGCDTARYTLRFAILHMMAFPDIQAKVQEEIDRVVGKDRLPTIKDRPDLSYTEAVLRESMRLSSVKPSGITHRTTCDTTVGGYKIPKGTDVTINYWALLNDPEAWPEVEKFIPERYLDDKGKLGPKPKNWLPFSAGKRVCLGEFVAKPELHLLFASLMQRYKWKAEPGTKVNLEAVSCLFSRSPKPYKCIIEKRV